MTVSSSDEPERPTEHPGYRIYTTKFDIEIPARHLDSALGPLSPKDDVALIEAWHALQMGLLPWKTRLHIIAAEAAARLRSCLREDERADTVVSLLIDHSGSMRGQKMLFAAATADITQEFLLTLGISCEVLGFTTLRWRGGQSRSQWKWRLRPSRPGRLNDILHIIYRTASDRRTSTGSQDFRYMLRPDLPKENIDGEALQWAAKRLTALSQRRKYLVVLSDGAPVDDSTLQANGLTYLSDHLKVVVKTIAEAGDIHLSAIGIGYQDRDFYSLLSHANAPDELGTTMIAHIERVLSGQELPS
jgi:cobaltochelatase CobT